MRGHITEERYFEIFFKDQNLPFVADDLEQAFTDEFAVKVPGTIELYRRFSAYPKSFAAGAEMVDGIPEIIVVSDHITEYIDEIMYEHYDVFTLTSGQIWSCYEGKIKSDPGFFPELLTKLNLKADEVLFIDDYDKNIEAAKAAGIESILFECADQLEEDLTELGFEFYA